MSWEERFWSKVDKSGDCWIWTAGTRRGYGQFYKDGRHQPSHRVSFESANGPIPEGLVVDHICRNPSCVRPTHLRAVTQRQNLLHGPTIIAAALAKTECNNGHPLSGENLRIDHHGWRICRTCERARWQRREGRLSESRGPSNASKTHCVNGHPFDEANTRLWQGLRQCRACNRAAVARYKARKQAALGVPHE